MVDHFPRTLLAILTSLLVTAGCSDPQAGTPGAPATTTSPSISNAAGRYGAPPVPNPLDMSRFLAQPCTTLTPSQLQSLDLPGPGKPDTTSSLADLSGPSCTWRNSPAASHLAISFITGNKNGLADIYREHAEGKYPGYWIETIVEGYPALFVDAFDNRKDGACVMIVGISDTLAVLVDVQDRTGEKSCDRAKSIAALATNTWRAGG